MYADIELINSGDFEMVRRNLMDKDEVRRMRVNMLVDSGAYMLAINETILSQLDIPIVESGKRRWLMEVL